MWTVAIRSGNCAGTYVDGSDFGNRTTYGMEWSYIVFNLVAGSGLAFNQPFHSSVAKCSKLSV